MALPCKNLLIGVTGSVGCVELPPYLIKLRQIFAENVYVMMSQAAQKFLPAYTMQLYTGKPVITDTFDTASGILVPHIELAQQADLFLILPATANILGKAAHAICDDLISTTIVACKAPIVFAPSMNEAMWSDRLVQRNIAILKEVGYYILDPAEGTEVSDLQQGGKVIPSFESLFLSLKLILAAGAPPAPPV